MKITIVPAQITTIEDKVAGNLSLAQLVLLVTPVFLSGLLYAIAPPSFGMAIYKIVVMSLIFVVIGSLAIKIRGHLLVNWFVILIRYNLRPQYYVFRKSDNYLRDNDAPKTTKVKSKIKKKNGVSKLVTDSIPSIAIHDKARLEVMMANPQAKLAFKISRKGGLNVYITEIK